MSFGFSVSDFLAVLELAKRVYEACRDGPAEYRDLCSETKSMRYTIQNLYNDARDPNSLLNRKGINRKSELDDIIRNCNNAMKEMQALVDKHSRLAEDGHGSAPRIWDAYQVGSSDLDSLRGKLTFYTSMISMFLLSLEGSAIARIESKLDKIYTRMLEDDLDEGRGSVGDAISTVSIISEIETREDDVWAILKRELLEEGISIAHIMANKESIIKHVKLLLEEDAPFNVPDDGNDDVDLVPVDTNMQAISSANPMILAQTKITVVGPPRVDNNKGLVLADKDPGIELVLETVKTGTFGAQPACFLGFILCFGSSAAAALELSVYAEFKSAKTAQKSYPSYSKELFESSLKIVKLMPEAGMAVSFIIDDSARDKTMQIEDGSKTRGWSIRSAICYLSNDFKIICQASWIVMHPSLNKGTNLGIRLGLILLHNDEPFVGRFQIQRRKPIRRMMKKVPCTYFMIEGTSDFDLERYMKEWMYSAEKGNPNRGVPIVH